MLWFYWPSDHGIWGNYKRCQNVFKQVPSCSAQVAMNKYCISNTHGQSMIHAMNIDTFTEFLLNKCWNTDRPSHYVTSTIIGMTAAVTHGQPKLWQSINHYLIDCFSSCYFFKKVVTYKSFTVNFATSTNLITKDKFSLLEILEDSSGINGKYLLALISANIFDIIFISTEAITSVFDYLRNGQCISWRISKMYF